LLPFREMYPAQDMAPNLSVQVRKLGKDPLDCGAYHGMSSYSACRIGAEG